MVSDGRKFSLVQNEVDVVLRLLTATRRTLVGLTEQEQALVDHVTTRMREWLDGRR